MRSPPARRSPSPYYSSADHRLFSLRMALCRGRSWSSRFEWGYNFVRCLILLSWMTSCAVGIPRSSWIISLLIYHGASTVALDNKILLSPLFPSCFSLCLMVKTWCIKRSLPENVCQCATICGSMYEAFTLLLTNLIATWSHGCQQ